MSSVDLESESAPPPTTTGGEATSMVVAQIRRAKLRVWICMQKHPLLVLLIGVITLFVTLRIRAYLDTVFEFSGNHNRPAKLSKYLVQGENTKHPPRRIVTDIHSDIIHDIRALPMYRYKWPLEIDAQAVFKQYKEGTLSLKPITEDNTVITLHPDKKHCKEEALVTVLIKTRVQDRFNRDLLRRTWVQDLYNVGLQHSFLLGQCYSKKCQESLDAELNEHQDIIQGNFIDAYHNNTIKFRMALKYIAYHCKGSKYVLIIDGDYSFNAPRLPQFLKKLNYPKKFYAGKLWPNSRPFRNSSHPQYMSFEFYPFRLLPPFIAAGASLLSSDIVEQLDVIAKYTRYVPFDDVFYAMVARKLGITLVDASNVLPSWFIPKVDDLESHRKLIASHRFGNLTQVEIIHNLLHN